MSEKVRKMFSDIAGKYDLLNTLLSLGVHHKWRQLTVKHSKVERGAHVLDCASGTADLAIEYKMTAGADGVVYATDFCPDMLEIGRAKAREHNIDLVFEQADIMNLHYDDNSFDIASVAFGIRNVDNAKHGIGEMARVVKPGGRVIVLEFGQPQGLFRHIYKLYSKYYMPMIGKMISGNNSAYSYLPETAAKFPCREQFTKLMEESGRFTDVRYYSLTFGVAYIYVGSVREGA